MYFTATNIDPVFITDCSRNVNGTTGRISTTFKWKIEPIKLPYSMLESMWYINVIISEARWKGSTSFTVGMSRSNVSISAVGMRELEVEMSGPETSMITATISLDSNATGELEIKNLESSLDPNVFLFEVSIVSGRISGYCLVLI